MITAILAGVFFILNPTLGVIVALVMPSVIGLSKDGNYSQVIAVVFLFIAFHFLQQQFSDM